ncbi:uncharacterized protein LAESUDRAFT_500067 [Laetiporus sulphureus 93-53]|uniref:Uncharacterized protein n=1 Tax=Laetiporus sulphureus 93-53 TaxID=1314785 RepID=A0A165BG13_9APHY|nr:uncharacterized protein LAESUDRAFT_500067 [Laetiporus sulphureus 93-53]KZT00980.1 hypothetical protein LAESUDRAFT_500067 [Laetiporus sulphureus 93-53]
MVWPSLRSLSPGIYTITNLACYNRANLPNDDEKASVTCKIPRRTMDAEQWEIQPSESQNGGRYTIRNVKYNQYASFEMNPEVASPVFGSRGEGWWVVTEMDSNQYGEDTYSIVCYHHSGLSWTLPDEGDNTPIELHPFARDRRSLWKIAPYPPLPKRPFPFTDRSILSLRSVEQTADTQYLHVQFEWIALPPNTVLEFPEPLLIVFHSEVIAEVQVEGEFKTNGHILFGTLRADDTNAFASFASTVVRDDDVQVSLEIYKFKYYAEETPESSPDRQYTYRHAWKKNFTFKGLRSFRERVTLCDFRITGSADDDHGPYMKSRVTVNIVNASVFTTMATISVGVYIGQTKIGTGHAKNLQLLPDTNTMNVQWQYRPLSPANQEVQNLMDQYFTTSRDLPITLSIESMSANICGNLVNLPRFDVDTRISGIGMQFIHHVDIHISAVAALLQRRVSFSFDIENPLDATLEIRDIELDCFVKGAHIASVKHRFWSQNKKARNFIIPPKEKQTSPRVPHAWLVADFVKTIQLACGGEAFLDVKVKSATLRIDRFILQGLTYNLHDIEFKLHWFH